ncbi:MAG: hypothetical protein KJ921_06310, partial [Proteobacteria bacterium]|nr:hypothetical protein [Pseudomonadota bacterium]
MENQEQSVIVGRHAVAQALAEQPEMAGELLLATGDQGPALNRLADAARAAWVPLISLRRLLSMPVNPMKASARMPAISSVI